MQRSPNTSNCPLFHFWPFSGVALVSFDDLTLKSNTFLVVKNHLLKKFTTPLVIPTLEVYFGIHKRNKQQQNLICYQLKKMR